MNTIDDLAIEQEILPLFNFSLNAFTSSAILELLRTTLPSTQAVTERQNILKGFMSNHSVLSGYSYAPTYLNEVHFFLNNEKIEDVLQKRIGYRLWISKSQKTRYVSKFNQLILFLYRLQNNYFSRLNLGKFPKKYSIIITQISSFLAHFELHKYEQIVRENQLKNKHIIALAKTIMDLKTTGQVAAFWETLFLFEAYLSISLGIVKHQFVFPSFIKQGIKLTGLYHPLIETPVKNNFETLSNVIVLNGPNMSGKSTFLRAIGLCMYLAHLGLAIPARFGEIPFCNSFSVQINKSDSLRNGYSHFMTEITALKTVVKNAINQKHCFAIFDELFSGTNPEDALEICKTTLKGLTKFKNSYFFVSTHMQELKNIINTQISNYYIDCQLINDTPKFTYKLKKGWSNVKVGQLLFDKEGLNKMLQ